MSKETLNSKELIYELYHLCSNRQFKKPKPLPEFNIKEALFIRDLIFHRPKDIIYFYLTNHISCRTGLNGIELFNSRGYKRYLFVMNFLKCKGNATKAAILSGYSPRSAKQQGHRILRYIQGYFRNQHK